MRQTTSTVKEKEERRVITEMGVAISNATNVGLGYIAARSIGLLGKRR